MQASMAPTARILAYYLNGDSSKELVADSLNFNVDGAFDRNKVSSTVYNSRYNNNKGNN